MVNLIEVQDLNLPRQLDEMNSVDFIRLGILLLTELLVIRISFYWSPCNQLFIS